MNELPVELLCEIFLLALSENVDERMDDLGTLRSVCRFWNAVAEAPRLWTGISITGDSNAADLARMEYQLRQSKAALLDIEIESSDVCEPVERVSSSAADARASHVEEGLLASAARLLRPHIHRTRSIDLSLYSDEAVTAILPLEGRFPLLDTLKICTYDTISMESLSKLELMAPGSLCSPLELEIDTAELDPSVFNCIDTDRLQTVRITTSACLGPPLLEFLARAQGVKSMKICDGQTTSRDVHSTLRIHTPLLHSLEISGRRFIESIPSWSTPRLEHLTITGKIQNVVFAKPITFSALRTLTVTNRQPQALDAGLAKILKWCPSLLAIDIPSYHHFATQVLETLVQDNVCPNLEMLRIRAHHEELARIIPALRAFLDKHQGAAVVHLRIVSRAQMDAAALVETYPTRVVLSNDSSPLSANLLFSNRNANRL